MSAKPQRDRMARVQKPGKKPCRTCKKMREALRKLVSRGKR